MPAARLLAMLAEGYRKQQFPKSPELNPSAIAIVDSSTSFLVQAADVVGNFSMNYVIRNLASTTASRTKKAEIFDSVFHDLLPQTTQFGKLASLTAPQLELALNQAGALTSFCLETLSNGRCAVIDRAYSVDSAAVGAVYDRPICSFETETN